MTRHLFIFLIQILILHSFAQTIPNCEEFDPNTSTCLKCQDKYFPLFNNLFCIPCDYKDYGQVGCGGKCDASRYENDRFAYCEKNGCKEGYYEVEGLCLKCDTESPGCKTCYNKQTQMGDLIDYEFSCQECLNNEYKMDEFGSCQKCQMENCLKCIYTDDYTNKECVQCEYNHYISSAKTCEHCNQENVGNGYCIICSDDLTDIDPSKCYCQPSYFFDKNNTCSFCIEDCSNCIYTENDQIAYCLGCDSGTILYNNKCLKYPENCISCEVDPDDTSKTKCNICDSGYFLINDQCQSCGDGCSRCILDQNYNIDCLECVTNYYTFSPEKTCIECSSISSLGNGCSFCRYNESKTSYECLECEHYYENYLNGRVYNSDYSYIKNKYQCLRNDDSGQKYLYGCLEANFIEIDKYECLKCKYNFIPLINDKTCKSRYEVGLSDYCLEALNIGDELNPTYSCNKCNNETVLLTSSNGTSDCVERSGNLAYCLRAKEENTANICTECVSLGHLTEQNTVCQCDSDSFGFKNLACYKCDDEENKGNIGCEAIEGCEYRPQNEQLNCNKCKKGFFEFTKGQCFPCSNELEFCNECHLDENSQFICDGCMDNFIYNKYDKICELNCQEYPEVFPGCIICNEEYKSKKKCQACKPGYFKTEDESCVYCRNEKYGGPACDRCAKNVDNGEIVCAICEGEDKFLNSKGKCYFNQDDSLKECVTYKFKIIGGEEKLVCAFCKDGFYLDTNGNCVSFLDYLEKIDNCYSHYYEIGKINIYYDLSNSLEYFVNENEFYVSSYNAYQFNESFLEFVNSNLRQIDHLLTAECRSCNSGYLKNAENKCVHIKVEDCTIIAMIKDSNLYYECQNLCKNNQYPLVLLNLNKEDEEPSYVTISEIYDKIRQNKMLLSEVKSLLTQTLCIDNSENSLNNNLKNCALVKYFENENKFLCHFCQDEYFLYKETNQCYKYDTRHNCDYENIGTETNPILSCKRCLSGYHYFDYYSYFNNYETYNESDYIYDSFSNYIMAKEGNINFCVEKTNDLYYCLNANVDTTYAINKINCMNCSINYLPYFSKFYDRYVCQSIFDEIKTSKNDLNNYYQGEYSIEATNGECPDNTYFSPDGEICYKCNSYLGMPGCNSKCSYSLERNNIIKCFDG